MLGSLKPPSFFSTVTPGKLNLIELKIIEDFSEFEADVIEEDKLDVEDTMTVLSDFVDTVSTDLDKDKIKNMLRTLYIEAQHVSV